MNKSWSILKNSLRLTFQELRVNKLRTGLSLTGIAFGIFCIIGVMATMKSLEINIQSNINNLGSNTIFVDKWEYGGGGDKPYWKYRARPAMKYEEVGMMKERSLLLGDACFLTRTSENVSFGDNVLQGVSMYGIIQSQINVQPLSFESGRYISDAEFTNGSPVAVIGHDVAEKLFGIANRALGNQIELRGKKLTVVGIIQKQGNNSIGWDYDNCVMLPFQLCRRMIDVNNSNPVIIAKGKPNVAATDFSNELEGIMRQIRRLSPTQEDNFSLNSVEAFSKAVTNFFGTVDLVGALIGIVSLIVGMFGIANIMFVTVKERTPIIGLKKAIGAKQRSILFEFLAEAAILCLMGGAIGLIFVYILTIVLSGPLNFPIFVSIPLLIATILICLVVGVLAGIFPALRAARMDPVVAIRSK